MRSTILNWSFHRKKKALLLKTKRQCRDCKFFRNRVSPFCEIKREGKYLRALSLQ